MKSSLKWIIGGLVLAGVIATIILTTGGGPQNAPYLPNGCTDCGLPATECDPCPCIPPPIHDGTTVIHEDPNKSLSGRGPESDDCLNFDENCKLHFNYSGAINGKCNNNTAGVYATISAKLYNSLGEMKPAEVKFLNYEETVSSFDNMTLSGDAFNYDPDCDGTCKAYFFIEITYEPPALPLPTADENFKTVIYLTGHKEGINITTPHDHALPNVGNQQLKVVQPFGVHTHEVIFEHCINPADCNNES